LARLWFARNLRAGRGSCAVRGPRPCRIRSHSGPPYLFRRLIRARYLSNRPLALSTTPPPPHTTPPASQSSFLHVRLQLDNSLLLSPSPSLCSCSPSGPLLPRSLCTRRSFPPPARACLNAAAPAAIAISPLQLKTRHRPSSLSRWSEDGLDASSLLRSSCWLCWLSTRLTTRYPSLLGPLRRLHPPYQSLSPNLDSESRLCCREPIADSSSCSLAASPLASVHPPSLEPHVASLAVNHRLFLLHAQHHAAARASRSRLRPLHPRELGARRAPAQP
jgi:hypothetical protein